MSFKNSFFSFLILSFMAVVGARAQGPEVSNPDQSMVDRIQSATTYDELSSLSFELHVYRMELSRVEDQLREAERNLEVENWIQDGSASIAVGSGMIGLSLHPFLVGVRPTGTIPTFLRKYRSVGQIAFVTSFFSSMFHFSHREAEQEARDWVQELKDKVQGMKTRFDRLETLIGFKSREITKQRNKN
jgi:hypothetical protein